MPKAVALVVAMLALLLSWLAMSSETPAAKKKPRKPPPSYWGGWIGPQLTGTEAPYDMGAVHQFQNLLGKGLSIVEWSRPFADCNQSPCIFYDFQAAEMEKVRNYGAIPFLSWGSSSLPVDVNQPDFQLSDVISGRYDSYIASWAQGAKNWGNPFFLRFNWEMTGDWFPWSEGVNGNQPGEYVAAWRHVHDIFTSVGANNVTWVWCPLVDKKNTLQKLKTAYPGDSYVDWTCLDGYNWGATPVNPHPWRSFDKIFKVDYRRVVKKIARKKPMILAEMGSNSAGGNKARWITKMFKELRTDYRKVRGVIWFDHVDRNIDWPLETSPGATAAFAKGIKKKAYKTNIYGGISGGAIPAPRRR